MGCGSSENTAAESASKETKASNKANSNDKTKTNVDENTPEGNKNSEGNTNSSASKGKNTGNQPKIPISPVYEVISLHFGGMGVKLGQYTWGDLSAENGIGDNGLYTYNASLKHDGSTIQTYFYEGDGRYYPRSIFFDMDGSAMDFVREKTGTNLFHDSSFLLGSQSQSGLYSSGYYNNGPAYIEQVNEKIRKDIEKCERFNGFLIYSALAGGCGSGFSALISQTLADEYSSNKKIGFHLYPSVGRSTNPDEFFNTVLAHDKLLELQDLTICLENEAILNILKSILKIEKVTSEYINTIIAKASYFVNFNSTGAFVKLDYPVGHLVPYPRIHFATVGYATFKITENYQILHEKLNSMLLKEENCSVTCKNDEFMNNLGLCMAYRGEIDKNLSFIQEAFNYVKNKKKNDAGKDFYFVENKRPVARKGGLDLDVYEAICVRNYSGIFTFWESILSKFNTYFENKGDVKRHVSDGVEEGEFIEAKNSISSIISDYKSCQSAVKE